jgi:hypothetical protein
VHHFVDEWIALNHFEVIWFQMRERLNQIHALRIDNMIRARIFITNVEDINEMVRINNLTE